MVLGSSGWPATPALYEILSTEWLKQQTFTLMILEMGSPRSRCHQDEVPAGSTFPGLQTACCLLTMSACDEEKSLFCFL